MPAISPSVTLASAAAEISDMPKAWGSFNFAAAVAASHNITSIADTGTGAITVTIAMDFSSHFPRSTRAREHTRHGVLG